MQDNPPSEIYWQAESERHYVEALIHRGLDTSSALDKVEALAVRSSDALNYRVITGWRGEVALQAEHYDEAIGWFEESLRLYRKAGSSFSDWVFGGLARAYALKGAHERAREIVAQLGEDDVNVAEVYQLLGETDLARKYAIMAYKGAWADGPPYVWWWQLERAKKVLDALGEPYPEMPAFDASKIGKYAYQDEIEAYIERKRAEHAEDDEETE